jgi:DNA-binding NtrC family response regulator
MNSPQPSASSVSCLLLDDDAGFASMMARLVREEGGEPTLVTSVAEARSEIARRGFDLAILDNRLGDGTGFEFYPELRRRCPDAVVMMITGAPELAQAVELTRNGLFDYLTKPISAADFTASLRRARLRMSRPESADAGEFVGSSPALAEVIQVLRQAARHSEAPVLLLGETGTGKDLAARRLHQLTYGPQAATAPYIALNCSAVPADMFEAELFGSEKGAYTGADRRRPGLIEAAQGGTLFLDEVAEIPLPLQAKLLRFLENREFRALGSTVSRPFHGRVVAATNRSLADEVRAGRLREDLRYRLDVLSVRLPPLREHLADLPALAEALLAQLAAKYGRRKPLLRPADLEALRGHQFPGNVRELRNLIERSLLKALADVEWLALDLAWLNPAAPEIRPASVATPAPAAPTAGAPERVPGPTSDRAETGSSAPPAERQLSPIEAAEHQLIAQALRAEGGGIRRAAARLGLTHQALLRRLQKWPELRAAARE